MAMMQNLRTMLFGAMTSRCTMWTSGDAAICKMIPMCCDGMMIMMECGRTAEVCMNNTPVCC